MFQDHLWTPCASITGGAQKIITKAADGKYVFRYEHNKPGSERTYLVSSNQNTNGPTAAGNIYDAKTIVMGLGTNQSYLPAVVGTLDPSIGAGITGQQGTIPYFTVEALHNLDATHKLTPLLSKIHNTGTSTITDEFMRNGKKSGQAALDLDVNPDASGNVKIYGVTTPGKTLDPNTFQNKDKNYAVIYIPNSPDAVAVEKQRLIETGQFDASHIITSSAPYTEAALKSVLDQAENTTQDDSETFIHIAGVHSYSTDGKNFQFVNINGDCADYKQKTNEDMTKQEFATETNQIKGKKVIFIEACKAGAAVAKVEHKERKESGPKIPSATEGYDKSTLMAAADIKPAEKSPDKATPPAVKPTPAPFDRMEAVG